MKISASKKFILRIPGPWNYFLATASPDPCRKDNKPDLIIEWWLLDQNFQEISFRTLTTLTHSHESLSCRLQISGGNCRKEEKMLFCGEHISPELGLGYFAQVLPRSAVTFNRTQKQKENRE